MKRFILVVTFNDPKGAISNLADAATWAEAALGRDEPVEVTAYGTALACALDETMGNGDFATGAEPVRH